MTPRGLLEGVLRTLGTHLEYSWSLFGEPRMIYNFIIYDYFTTEY